jgi:HTH-type transcriptional regulator / antitoxin HipB
LRGISAVIFPYGNMKYTPKQIGEMVKKARKQMGATQKELAMTSGTGLRFIIELEQGKPTCQIGKVLTVLNTLGVNMTFTPPTHAETPGASIRKKGA